MLIEEAKVGLAPGDAFLVGEPGWFRLCFAQTDEQLNEALGRLSPFLAKAREIA
ncbi:aminotransferase class I/II-fold pyridoxal phosphate-dependent enzyme [Pseudovibrio denitrificans]|uniref:aminotransferase class I/II-fold pyridoxal phosphate-dependent enzyme n=1 Tax=Pseudovibrio denitrificans TaxID=258256 RepID=UPI0039BEE2E5